MASHNAFFTSWKGLNSTMLPASVPRPSLYILTFTVVENQLKVSLFNIKDDYFQVTMIWIFKPKVFFKCSLGHKKLFNIRLLIPKNPEKLSLHFKGLPIRELLFMSSSWHFQFSVRRQKKTYLFTQLLQLTMFFMSKTSKTWVTCGLSRCL